MGRVNILRRRASVARGPAPEETKNVKKTRIFSLTGLAVVAAVLAMVPGFQGDSTAQRRPTLRIGSERANYGVHNVRGGFVPDPKEISVVSGGPIDARTLGLGSTCSGWVSAQPDVIVRYANPGAFLRFFVRASEDTTLVVNDASGRWFCSDDAAGGGHNPMVSIANPASGQYDIWIGSYRNRKTVRGKLFVTEMRSNAP